MATQELSRDPKWITWQKCHVPSCSKDCGMPLRNLNDFNVGEMRECDFQDRCSVGHDPQSALYRAIALSSMTADTALNALDKLAPCIWPRLVHAQAEIEALRSDLRAAREGEERAYEALKRLRTRENTRTRSSSRARMLVECGESKANSAASRTATDTSSPTQGTYAKNLDKISPFKDANFMDLDMVEERMVALAREGEDRKSKQECFWDITLSTTAQESLARMQAEHDAYRLQISDRDMKISELSTLLQEERLKSARHRDVAATVMCAMLTQVLDRIVKRDYAFAMFQRRGIFVFETLFRVPLSPI